MAVASRPGSEVFYEASGRGPAGFLLLHGWCADHESMRPIARHLSQRHRTVNMDLRGHGRSSMEKPGYGSADVVGDMLAVIEQSGLVAPVLIGHSIGAKFVLACVQSAPRAARGIVLLDTSIIESAQRKANRRAVVAEGRYADLRARLEAQFLPSAHSPHRDRIVQAAVTSAPDVALAALHAGDEVDMATALAGCELPVLYIGASKPMEDPQLMKNLNPRLCYGQAVGSGHYVQLDVPEQVNAMIDRFCELEVEPAWHSMPGK
jgi:pimeloyl-ACP methyl ester carboxylesterase